MLCTVREFVLFSTLIYISVVINTFEMSAQAYNDVCVCGVCA